MVGRRNAAAWVLHLCDPVYGGIPRRDGSERPEGSRTGRKSAGTIPIT